MSVIFCVANRKMQSLNFDYKDVKAALPNNVKNVQCYYLNHLYNPVSFCESFGTFFQGKISYTPHYKYNENVIREYCEMDEREFQTNNEFLYNESTNFFDWAEKKIARCQRIKSCTNSALGAFAATSLGANPFVGVVCGEIGQEIGNLVFGDGCATRVRRFPVYSDRTYVDNEDMVNYCVQSYALYDPNYYFSLNLSGSLLDQRNT